MARTRMPRKTKALARVDPHAALTQREVDGLVERLVASTNERVRKSDIEREGAADDLFREAFADDPALVLDAAPTTRVWNALSERAGKSLKLPPEELDDYVRAAALTQHVSDRRWRNLDFSDKLALLPLTRLDDGMRAFYRGLTFSTLPSTTTTALHDWVGRELPKKKQGRPEGLSYRGRGKITAGGLRLSDPEQRARFKREFRAAPKDGRSRFLKELRAVLRNLGLLLDELQEPDDS